MSSAHHLREFISERLSAAAGEIFSMFEQTIIQYEEEIVRQRTLLGNSRGQVELHTPELPQQNVCKEEAVLPGQDLCDQEELSNLEKEEPEPPQFKEEPNELCIGQDEKLCLPKEEPDDFMVTVCYGEVDQGDRERLLSHNSLAAEHHQNQMGNEPVDSGSTADAELWMSMPEIECETESVEKSVKCDICGKGFENKYLMKAHHRIHAGVKPYACKTCGKRFYKICLLRYHTRTHTGEKPYSCSICERSFSHSGYLVVHMRTHTGEKPYRCDGCGDAFEDAQKLKRHMICHTDENPYPCETCGQSFKRKDALLAHMRRHMEEEACVEKRSAACLRSSHENSHE